MTEALEEVKHAAVHFPQFPECQFTTVSLDIPRGFKFDRWLELGAFLRAAGKGIQFWIGDWIRFGEHEYGEKYSQAIELTGREEKTLQNWVFVAQNIHSSRRRELDQVDFTTHAEVASLPPEEQERILAEAEKEGLTRKQVRREAQRVKRRLGKEPSEVQIIQLPEVQDFLEGYIEGLKLMEEAVPTTAAFLRNMVHAHIGQAQWQMERTVEGDCARIMEAIEENNGLSDDQIFNWLQARGYYMRDPELDDRLTYMVNEKMIVDEEQGGKQEERRGKMPTFYVPFYVKRKKKEQHSEDEEEYES